MSDQVTVSGSAQVCGLMGSIGAAVISSALNHSFWWGFFHFLCGWFYILYVLLCRSKEILPALKLMFGA